jgi:hypothetical protein
MHSRPSWTYPHRSNDMRGARPPIDRSSFGHSVGVYVMNNTLTLHDKTDQIRELAAQIAIEQDQGRFTVLLKGFNDLVDPLHPPQPQPTHPPAMLPWP